MGNKLCKRKTDVLDGSSPKNQTPFDRIINRLHLRPTSWKSESYLNQKQVNRHEISPRTPSDNSNKIIHSQPLSKSSDWTDVSLEVPEKEDNIHLRNPKLSLIFNNENNENGTPTPPPRKHKRNFREKIEAVAKNGLQALQPKNKQQQPVEEPLFTKKKINYNCPVCDSDEKNHNRDHHHNHVVPSSNNKQDNHKQNGGSSNLERTTNKQKSDNRDGKRKKNLSVISLPNYNELKLTVVDFEDIDRNQKSSDGSLRLNNKKIHSSTGKLDGISRRCRSFGSLLPQQLKKLKMRKAPADIESDDSFGGLEDWDLGLIEHYNPKDASLPRIRNRLQKQNDKTEKEVLSGIEDLIVPEEDTTEKSKKPTPRIRQSESVPKKINKESSQNSPIKKITHKHNVTTQKKPSAVNLTPPPSPVIRKSKEEITPKSEEEKYEEIPFIDSTPMVEDGKVEHSSLMRILQEFSMKDKQNYNKIDEHKEKKCVVEDKIEESKHSSNQSSLTPSLLEFEKNLNLNSLEEFINVEKNNNTDVNLMSKRTNPVIIS